MRGPGIKRPGASRDPHPPRMSDHLETLQEADFVDDAWLEQRRGDGLALRGAVLRCLELSGVELHNVTFSGASFEALQITDGVFKHADLANITARRPAFDRVHITGSRLVGAQVQDATLRDVRLTDCRLSLASFLSSRLTRVRFERCDLTELDLTGTRATHCVFVDCDLFGARLSDADLRGSAFSGCRLVGVDGINALRCTQMTHTDLIELASALAASLEIEISDEIV